MNFHLGPSSTTFTIIARCEHTGTLGMGISTSTIAVAARCSFIRCNVGVVATQAYADPALGPLGLNLLELGFTPEKVLQELRGSDKWFEFRQIGIIDAEGRLAVVTGTKNMEWKGHVAGKDHIAMGNYLAGPAVIERMSEAYASAPGELFEERLMRALEAGAAAGGDRGGQLSAGLLTYAGRPYPRTDLRIDLQEPSAADPRDAVGALRTLFDEFRPLIEYYERKPREPMIGSWKDWVAAGGPPTQRT